MENFQRVGDNTGILNVCRLKFITFHSIHSKDVRDKVRRLSKNRPKPAVLGPF